MKLYRYLALGALTLGVSACDGLLDTTPRQSVDPEQIRGSLSTFRNILAGAYSRLQSTAIYGQRLQLAPEILADNALIGPNPSNRYRTEEQFGLGTGVGGWATYYSLVNDANVIIAGIDFPEGTDAQKGSIKGEAYFLRALAYHNLAKVYAYEPEQAAARGFNLGVILRTEPTETADDASFRARAPVDSVYMQIESDLLASIDLLTRFGANTAPSPKYRASKASAKALLARVYLYAGRHADAETYATQALADAASVGAVLASRAQYITAFESQPNPESLFELSINPQTESIGANESLVSLVQPRTADQVLGGRGFWGDVVPSPELLALFGPGDVRDTLFVSLRVGSFNYTVTTKYGAVGTNYADNVPIIRYAEVLLIRAEARLQQGNTPGALADLNTLRTTRGATALTSATLGDILTERRLELNFEGHRFFDLKRLGLTVTKPADTRVVPIQPDDPRLLSPIPNAQVELNPRLRQNPGY